MGRQEYRPHRGAYLNGQDLSDRGPDTTLGLSPVDLSQAVTWIEQFFQTVTGTYHLPSQQDGVTKARETRWAFSDLRPLRRTLVDTVVADNNKLLPRSAVAPLVGGEEMSGHITSSDLIHDDGRRRVFC